MALDLTVKILSVFLFQWFYFERPGHCYWLSCLFLFPPLKLHTFCSWYLCPLGTLFLVKNYLHYWDHLCLPPDYMSYFSCSPWYPSLSIVLYKYVFNLQVDSLFYLSVFMGKGWCEDGIRKVSEFPDLGVQPSTFPLYVRCKQ